MLFNSIEFLLFFPLVTALYYLIPFKFRWVHLLISSCIFYIFFIPQYIFILFTTIIIDYYLALLIEKKTGKQKKTLLILSVIATILVLCLFKYLNFFNENMLLLSQKFDFYYPEKTIQLAIPIGLSFHTFQSLSYVIEVYRGNQKAEKNFGIYSLFVMFYPQLVTGPIERPQNLLKQLRENKKFELINLKNGIRLIIYGLFIKMVVADNLAEYVDKIYLNPLIYETESILTSVFLYSFQIYCDFLGYSTIAVGCAKSMGYNLIDNFRTPYLAKNISEFWQRWHISLSTWFRDYVYFPLGGNRVKFYRFVFNILCVFLLSGFWHGANWTFIIWGAAHGTVYIIELTLNKLKNNYPLNSLFLSKTLSFINVIKTFIIVSFIWVIFRSPDLNNAKIFFNSILHNEITVDDFNVSLNAWVFLILFIVTDFLLYETRFDNWINSKPILFRWVIYAVLIFSILVFSNVNSFPFIYFQF